MRFRLAPSQPQLSSRARPSKHASSAGSRRPRTPAPAPVPPPEDHQQMGQNRLDCLSPAAGAAVALHPHSCATFLARPSGLQGLPICPPSRLQRSTPAAAKGARQPNSSALVDQPGPPRTCSCSALVCFGRPDSGASTPMISWYGLRRSNPSRSRRISARQTEALPCGVAQHHLAMLLGPVTRPAKRSAQQRRRSSVLKKYASTTSPGTCLASLLRQQVHLGMSQRPPSTRTEWLRFLPPARRSLRFTTFGFGFPVEAPAASPRSASGNRRRSQQDAVQPNSKSSSSFSDPGPA